MTGIQERYIKAQGTSDMTVDAFERPADVVIAAGMAGHRRGALFARLRAEFDEVHAAVKRESPATDAVNLRLATVLRLRSLREAKAAAAEVGADLGHRLRVELDTGDEPFAALVWQSLSVWLDPSCGHCGGRGFNGGYDGPALTCRHCKGTRNRRGNTGKTHDERLFVDRLSMEIEAEMQRFHSAADSKLRQG